MSVWDWVQKSAQCIGQRLGAFFTWLIRGLLKDVRSAVVGAAVASLISFAIAYSDAPQRETWIYTNDGGIAEPFKVLLGELRRVPDSAEAKYDVKFEPLSLQSTYVCEFSHLTGKTAKDMLFQYLSRYSGCFVVSEISGTSIVIRPNKKSGIMIDLGDTWNCKCQVE
ncbi:hypothetical protein [Ancylobacter sp. FA202]|uniref:hypothetical protein n=1 Tax=Ancylobacter sp. FA202 TaxID=1111106 RepID=UPI0012DD9234|nr:hypothetical protein [Ancylobacter sp. FA202]